MFDSPKMFFKEKSLPQKNAGVRKEACLLTLMRCNDIFTFISSIYYYHS